MTTNPFRSDWLRAETDTAGRPQRGLSYVAGATDVPLRFITLPGLLDEAVERHGGHEAAYFAATGRRWSWYDLRSRADEVAAGLLALGLKRGDRMGLWASTSEEWLGTFFGATRVGAIVVPLNPAWGAAELEHALNVAGCRVLVLSRYAGNRDNVATLRDLAPEIDRTPTDGKLRAERLPRLRHVVLLGEGATPAGAMTFQALRRLAGPAQTSRVSGMSAAVDPDDVAVIQFTSGPADRSRGAALTHRSLANNATFAAACMKLSADDRFCVAGALHHWFGLGPGLLAGVAAGATMVFPAPGFDAAKTLAAIGSQRCTMLHAAPSMLTTLLDHPSRRSTDLTHLRGGIAAGGPLTPEAFRRITGELHLPELVIGYGKSESSPLAFQSSAGDPASRRAEAIGRVLPHVEAKVVDEAGRIVRVGERGELRVRGYLTMNFYWKDLDATRSVIDPAGWLRTGDLATLEPDGYLRIVGRVGVTAA
ncbi:MAG: AMP-binding protein [Burkholderiales bacterium]|nr:AMP-binding protein [Burkholderiales bacterium]